MGNWVAAMARKKARHVLVVIAAVLGVLALVACLERRFVRNVFLGPFAMSATALGAIDPARSPIYFVKVTGSRAFETGINVQDVSTKDWTKFDRTVVSEDYALAVGDKYLVVETAKLGPPRDLVVEGTLVGLEPDLRAELVKFVGGRNVEEGFYPFVLKAGSLRGTAYGIGAALLALAGVMGGIGWPSVKIAKTPQQSPVMKKISGWGDPAQVSMSIGRECRTSLVMSFGTWLVSDHYLVHSGLFAFDVFRVEDVLWAYKRARGRTFRAHFVFVDEQAVVNGPEGLLDELVEWVGKTAPGAVIGFSFETLARYEKNPVLFRQAIEQAKRTARPS